VSNNTDIKAAIDEIGRAFAHVKYPGDDKLVSPGTRSYCEEVLSFVGIVDWKHVPDSIIIEEGAALSFFSPEALRFFLPAFMLWVLGNFDKSRAFVVDRTIYTFVPSDRYPEITRNKIRQLTEALTTEQRAAVLSFLRIMERQSGRVDTEAATKALALMSEIEKAEQG
jgi:hypothetical protein